MECGAQANLSDLIDAGLEYERRGWCIIPIAQDKEAAVSWKRFQSHRPRPGWLPKIIQERHATGIAVLPGSISGGVGLRDFDVCNSYFKWRDAHPEESRRLPTVQTARGYHVFGRVAHNSYQDFGDGELRADPGHYAILPPSWHPEGVLYRWIIPLPPVGVELPSLPNSLLGNSPGTPSSNRYSRCTSSKEEGIWEVWDKEDFVQKCIMATMPKGPSQRNKLLFKLVQRLKFSGFQFTATEQQEVVRTWLNGAIAAGTKDTDFLKSWNDWKYSWQRARGGVIGVAKAAARKSEGSVKEKLVKLCQILADAEGKFFLSYDDAAIAAGCSKKGAYKAMANLREQGAVVLIRCGEPKLGGKASEWRLQ